MSESIPPATQINSVSVETPQGLRTFELFAGDVFSQEADLLVISTHHEEDEPPSGPLVETIENTYGLPVDVSQPFMTFGGGVTACVQPGNDKTPFRQLLTMRIAAPRSQENPSEFYDRAIQSTFAAIAALEFLGNEFSGISLPVLVRKGIADYESAVRALLRHALQWLRQSRHTIEVSYFVFNPDELSEWDRAMNESLGRTYVDTRGESLVNGLCRDLCTVIDRGGLRDCPGNLETSLRNAVANPKLLCVQTVATFGRKLAEAVTEQVCHDLQLPLGRDLMSNIETVRSSKMLAAWITSYLHSLRVFGNEGVHSLAVKRGVVPSELSPQDLLSILCAIRAIVLFWSEWQRNRTKAANAPHATALEVPG